MNYSPYVNDAIAEARSLGEWVKAQAASLWSAHKAATLVVFAAGVIVGAILF